MFGLAEYGRTAFGSIIVDNGPAAVDISWLLPLSDPPYFKARPSLSRAINSASPRYQVLSRGEFAGTDEFLPGWLLPLSTPNKFVSKPALISAVYASGPHAPILSESQFAGVDEILAGWWQPFSIPLQFKRKPALTAASAASSGPHAPVLTLSQLPGADAILPGWWVPLGEPGQFKLRPSLTAAAVSAAGPYTPMLTVWYIRSGFKGVAVTAALDKQMSISQQIAENLERVLRVSPYDGLGSESIPTARANRVIGFDLSGAVSMIPQPAFRPGVSRTLASTGLTITGAPSSVPTGIAPAVIYVSDYMTITGWSVTADAAGTFIADFWKTSISAYPATTAASSITGGNTVSLLNDEEGALGAMVSAYAGYPGMRITHSTFLNGWETSLSPGDILMCNVLAAAGCSRVTISLYGYRT